MLIIDLFAGAGGASEGIRLATGRHPCVAINHDAHAIQMHAENHPETVHLREDLTTVRPADVTRGRAVDLLWASPDCFPAGTLVLTSMGLRPIESVEEGELVVTHRGRYRRVTGRVSKLAETVAIRGHGHFGLVTTPNHPFYSKRITRRYPGKRQENGRRERPRVELVENPYWPEASTMTGKLWATPRVFPESSIPTCFGAEFSDDFFYLVGRWVGDGSVGKGDVQICTGINDFPSLLAIATEHPLRRADGDLVPLRTLDRTTTKSVVWGNASLSRWLAENFGDLCEVKSLPTWCLSMQASWRRALLRGYVDADGHVTGNRTEVITVSKALAISIRMLATSLGYAATMYFAPGRDGQIEGRSYKGRDAYRVHWRNELQHETVFKDSLHQFSPVREVTPTERTEDVYCLSVEEDESFVADGIVVHNCKHFSRAKGGKPRDQKIRSLAWVVVDWARDTRPAVICLENVPEFVTWGPLDAEARPIASRAGETFREFVTALERLGYRVEWRNLVAADYGAPTTRKRFFLVARCDGQPIRWPAPTHGPGRAQPYRTAAECIDWSIPVPSIFGRERPLAEATLRRVAEGVRRFVLAAPAPFIVSQYGQSVGRQITEPLPTVTAGGMGHQSLVVPSLIQTGYGERAGQAPRVLDLQRPLGTLVAGGQKHGLVAAFLAKHYGGVTGQPLDKALGTVTAVDHHSLVYAFLTKFFGTSIGSSLQDPVSSILAGGGRGGGHHGVVTVRIDGEAYALVDIGMRMLQPRELARAQGFRDDYVLTGSKSAQVARIGNSVCPPVARAVVAAQLGTHEPDAPEQEQLELSVA